MLQQWRAMHDFCTTQCRCKLWGSSCTGLHSNELQEGAQRAPTNGVAAIMACIQSSEYVSAPGST